MPQKRKRIKPLEDVSDLTRKRSW